MNNDSPKYPVSQAQVKALTLDGIERVRKYVHDICGPDGIGGGPFALIVERDHADDIGAALCLHDPYLPIAVGDVFMTEGDENAREMVLDGLRGLYVADRDLFAPTPLVDELYSLWLTVDGPRIPGPAQNGLADGGADKVADWRYHECDRDGQRGRRHRAYMLRDRARKLAKNKRGKAA